MRRAEMSDEKRRMARSLQCGHCSQIFSAPDGDGTVTCTHCGMSSSREVNAKCGKCSRIFIGVAGTNANCPYCKVENSIPEVERPPFTDVQCGSCKKTFTAQQQGGPHQIHNVQCPFCRTVNAFKGLGGTVKTVKEKEPQSKVHRPQNSKRDLIDLLKADIAADELDDEFAQFSRQVGEAAERRGAGSTASGQAESRDRGAVPNQDGGPARRASSSVGKEEIREEDKRRKEKEKRGEERRRREEDQQRAEDMRREEFRRRAEEMRFREEEKKRAEEKKFREEEKRRSATKGARDSTQGRDGAFSADSAAGPSARHSVGKCDEEGLGISAVDLELHEMRNKGTPLADRRRFFQQLCLRWHPDKNPDSRDESTRVFQHLQDKKDWFLS